MIFAALPNKLNYFEVKILDFMIHCKSNQPRLKIRVAGFNLFPFSLGSDLKKMIHFHP